ncbi:MAG: GEVED domain-containing protein [Salibacteraceae bacterium]
MKKVYGIMMLLVGVLFINADAVAQYCVPSSGNSWGYVSQVTTTGGDININKSTGSAFGTLPAKDYTATDSVSTGPGRSFNVSVTHTYALAIYIDWDDNGVFNTSNERVFTSTSTSSAVRTDVATITVPTSAATGQLRMRVMVGYSSGYTNPCGNTTFGGEAEDYTLRNTPPIAEDASVVEMTPSTLCPGVQDVNVRVRNMGSATMTSVTVAGFAGTTIFAPVTLTGLSLAPFADTVYTLGSHNFTVGSTIEVKAWSSMPNGIADTANLNDTISLKGFAPALSGDYTVGSSTTDDYGTIQAAIDDLEDYGLCGPVRILLNDAAAYSERVTISSIAGASAVNTLTITSNPLNTNMAKWEASGTSAQNYLVNLNNASYVVIDSISFENKSTSYGRVVAFIGSNNYITISNDSLVTKTTTTTSSNMDVVYDWSGAGNLSNNITLTGNYIYGGARSVYCWGGNTSTFQNNWTFDNNDMLEWYYRGLELYYVLGNSITNNNIIGKTSGTLYCCGPAAVYGYYSRNTDVIGNQLIARGGTSYGRTVYFSQCGSTSSATANRNVFANNMVSNYTPSSSSTTNTAAYFTGHNYVDFVNNSFYLETGSGSGNEAVYLSGSSAKVVNNAAHNNGAGYGIYMAATNYTRNNNAWYSPNGNAAGSNRTLGTNSMVANPAFVSGTDLHAGSPQMHDAGDTSYVSAIGGVDIDGDVRCPLATCIGSGSAPDIGADEYWLPDYEITPVADAAAPCSGMQNVTVKVKNAGVQTLTSFKVDWWIGTTAQTQLVVTGSSIMPGLDTTVVVGTHNFVNGTSYDFKFATSEPSGQADQIMDNDTLDVSIQNALSGVLTVGSGGDYPGLDSAINDLSRLGMCGPISFELMDSTFAERVTLEDIQGNNSMNTITFKSLASNANRAVIDGGIMLVNTTHVTIHNLEFTTTGNAIEVPSGGYITNTVIDSNKFTLGTTSGYGFRDGTYGRQVDSIWFTNNEVVDGYAAFWIYGGSTSDKTLKESNIWVENNTMEGWSYRGVYAYYCNNVHVNNNRIINGQGKNTYPGAAYIYYSNEVIVKHNVLQAVGTSGGYGLYMYSTNRYSGGSDSLIVHNNFIHVGSTLNAFTRYGIYLGYLDYRAQVYHNNVSVTGPSAGTKYAFYGRSLRNSTIRNNIFENAVGGSVAYGSAWSSVVNSDNDFWTGDTSNYGTVGFTRGANSLKTNPRFKNTSVCDLRVNSIELDSAGANLGVTEDIFGNVRNVANPDMGAHEFDPCYYDLVSNEYYSRYTQIPVGQSVRMYGNIGNVGLDSITGVNAVGAVGASSSTVPLGNLMSDADSSFSIAVPLAGPTGVVNASLYGTLNETDCDLANDTVTYSFEVSDTVYAYDDSTFTGGVGFTNLIGEFGSVFEIFANDTITSGSFYLNGPPQGATVRLMVYEFDTAGPGAKIDSTRAFQVGANGSGWYTLQFGCNGIAATPGQYLVCIDQPNPVNMALAYNQNGNGVAETRYSRVRGGSWADMYDNPDVRIANATLLLRVNLGSIEENDVLPATTLICNNSDTYINTNTKYAQNIWSNGLLFDSIKVNTPGTYSVTVWDNIGCMYMDSTVATMANPMTIASTPTNASCGNSDGSVNLTVSGSYAPHTFMWNDGSTSQNISNVAGGSYMVTITDSIGCSNVEPVEVLGAFPEIASAWTYPTCNGDNNGTATASIVTGIAPYTYAWNNGGSPSSDVNVNLTAGSYIVTVTDASNCSTIDTVEVEDPQVLTVSNAVTAPSACNMADGAAQANMNGGVSPYTFLWNNGQTTAKNIGLSEGIYDVTVTDSLGCVTITKMTVEDPNSPSAMPNDLRLDCSFDTTTAKVTVLGGTAPYNYSWNYKNSTTPTLNGVSAGAYKLHLTDAAGCDHDTTVVITAPSAVNVNFTNLIDNGEDKVSVKATTTGGTPAYTWNWTAISSNGIEYTTDKGNNTKETAVNLPNGVNKVEVLDANGCKFTFQIDVYSETTGTGYLANAKVYSIYPNPTVGLVNVELNLDAEDDVRIRVLDAVGNVITTEARDNMIQDVISIDLSNNANGVYFIETTVGAERIVNRIQVTH